PPPSRRRCSQSAIRMWLRWCIPAVMDRLRNLRPHRRPGGIGARRAGITALAVLAGTAALAILLAALFHLGVAAGGVTILGTLPALYLAWAALPGAIAAPTSQRKRRVDEWEPVELGVHPVIGGGSMPAYIRRSHDELLAAVLDPAAVASRLVVVRGESS